MKKRHLLLLLVLTTLLNSCFKIIDVNAGQESVLTLQPYLFGSGGVDPVAVQPGSKMIALTTSHTEFTTTPVKYTESFHDMMPADNTPISFNSYIIIQIEQGQSPKILSQFGVDWYINSVQETFRTHVRDVASGYKMFELASKREVTDAIQNVVFSRMTDYVNKIGLPVKVKGVIIGAATPPSEVLAENKNTAAQNQSEITQVARAKAELARKQAEINKALADRAYQEQMNMNVPQYLELRRIEIEKEKVEAIKDHPNVKVIFGPNAPYSYGTGD
jgi:hypothetical protein